jgi:hypothetical protein
MAQEIYKVWMAKYTPEWYKLSKAEQDALMAKAEEALKSVGAEELLIRVSVWCSENWQFWGVEKFPSIEAVQQLPRRGNAANVVVSSDKFKGGNCHRFPRAWSKPGSGGFNILT